MKKILITGCSTGFGFAAAQHLAGKGHSVYASMRNTSGKNAQAAFEDTNAPTDAGIVSEIFERLIETPAGERPLRTIAGLDFGFQQLNDAVEPFRKASLASMGLEEMDGPQKQTAGV